MFLTVQTLRYQKNGCSTVTISVFQTTKTFLHYFRAVRAFILTHFDLISALKRHHMSSSCSNNATKTLKCSKALTTLRTAQVRQFTQRNKHCLLTPADSMLSYNSKQFEVKSLEMMTVKPGI